MEGREILDGKLYLSESVSFESIDFKEKFLLKDFDSCLDELGSRLIVSRMVSNSVVKGTANAVIQEASEEIDSKEVEITVLKKMLFLSESVRMMCHGCGSLLIEGSTGKPYQSIFIGDSRMATNKQFHMLRNEIKLLQNMNLGDAKTFDQCNVLETLTRINTRVDALNSTMEGLYEQINKHYCLNMESFLEQQWRWDLEKDVQNIAVDCFIRDMQEFHMRSLEVEYFCRNQRKHWLKTSRELWSLREELDAISTFIFGSEPEGFETYEEWKSSGKKKNPSPNVLARFPPGSAPILENGDITSDGTRRLAKEDALYSQLSKDEFILKRELTKEELITYYLTEMARMSRQYESALYDKTEELFRLKRKVLRERTSAPFSKEVENLRSKIPEFILRLDNILEFENNDIQEDDGLFCNLKDKIGALLAENSRLKDLLEGERKDVKRLSSRLSDAVTQISLHTSAEVKFLEKLTKLRQTVEDSKIEAVLQNEIVDILYRNWAGSIRTVLESLQTELAVNHDIHLIVFREFVMDANFSIKAILQRYESEINFLRRELSTKDEALSLEKSKITNLQDSMESLSRIIQRYESELKFKDEALSLENSRTINLQYKIESLSMLIPRYESEVKFLREELSVKDEALCLENSKTTNLQDKMESLSMTIQRYESELNFLTKDLTKKDEALSFENSKTTNLQDQIESLSMLIPRYESEVKFLKEDLSVKDEALRLENSKTTKLQDKMESLSMLIQRYESELKFLTKDLLKKDEELCLANLKVTNLQDKMESLSILINRHESDVEFLREELSKKDTSLNSALAKTTNLQDTVESLSMLINRNESEVKFLREELSKKDEALSLADSKAANLQDKIESLSMQMQRKENMLEDNMSMLLLLGEKYELSLQGLKSLQKQKEEQEMALLHKEQEFDELKYRLVNVCSQLCQFEVERQKLNGHLKVAQDDLIESNKQRDILEKNLFEEKGKALSALVEKELATEKMKVLTLNVIELSRSLEEFESKTARRIQKKGFRLEKLKHQLDPVTQTAHSLHKEVSRYRRSLEIKLSNLQKAENEVDLLGDEVEALLSVLAKVYITLDHYSHILQHYPGVMEILKLVRTELEGSVKSHR